MRVKCVSSNDCSDLEEYINETLEELEMDDNVILDIKQSGSGKENWMETTVTIIYCTKKERRNIKLNNVLDEKL
jgi:uncharacterized protein YuzE